MTRIKKIILFVLCGLSFEHIFSIFFSFKKNKKNKLNPLKKEAKRSETWCERKNFVLSTYWPIYDRKKAHTRQTESIIYSICTIRVQKKIIFRNNKIVWPDILKNKKKYLKKYFFLQYFFLLSNLYLGIGI